MSDNLIKHLEEFFQEWDLNDEEKVEVKKVCNETTRLRKARCLNTIHF